MRSFSKSLLFKIGPGDLKVVYRSPKQNKGYVTVISTRN